MTGFGFRITNVQAAGTTAPTPTPTPTGSFPESAHPYADNYDNTWSYTLAGSASAIDVTFDSQTWVEAGFDYIHVSDGSGNAIAGSPFTGTSLAGQTKRITGRTVRVRLTSDGSVTGFGFRITNVQAAGTTAAPSPTTPSGDDTTSEVGAVWINNYNGLQTDLRNTDGDASGFYEEMTQQGATGRFDLGNDLAQERQFRDQTVGNGRDSDFVDAVDMAYYSGHGGTLGSGPSDYRAVLAFGNSQASSIASSREMILGDGDLEWLVLSACETLKIEDDRYIHAWRNSFRGLHMVLSFRTLSLDARIPFVVPNAGPDFANRIQAGDPIATAWLDAATNWFVRLFGVNYPAVMSAESQSGSTNTVDNDHWIGKGTTVSDILRPTVFRIRYIQ